MAERQETPFEAWTFTEEEEAVAMVFMPLQEQHLKTELSVIANERMILAVDPESSNAQLKFLLESEYLRGKLEILGYLLQLSNDKKNVLLERLRQQIDLQKDE